MAESPNKNPKTTLDDKRAQLSVQTVYVALLRGINVGGRNPIKMTDLTALFQDLGLTDVRTYIQSGNIIFSADETHQVGLTRALEVALSRTFNYDARVVICSHEQMKDIVAQAPEDFGSALDTYRYDVFFLKQPLTSSEAIQGIPAKEGVDQIYPGNGVLYASRLISRASQSRLTRIITMPIYQSMTIRNWNTTTKLLHMMEAANH